MTVYGVDADNTESIYFIFIIIFLSINIFFVLLCNYFLLLTFARLVKNCNLLVGWLQLFGFLYCSMYV